MGTGGQHREAITTRPALIEGVAQRTEHAREVKLEMTSVHGKTRKNRQVIEWHKRVSAHVSGGCDAVGREDAMKHPAAENLLVFLRRIDPDREPGHPATGGVGRVKQPNTRKVLTDADH